MYVHMRFEVLMMVTMKIIVFWDVILCFFNEAASISEHIMLNGMISKEL
jgi:hypothetical protein